MAHRFSLKPVVVSAVEEKVSKVQNVVEEREGPARVTPAMVSEAANAVLETVEPQHADVIRRLWSNDSQTDAARLLFQSEISERAKSSYVNWDKPVLRLNETLDAEQTAKCIAYAPEYQLVFRNSVKHDHPMFAAARKIDHALLLAKFPPGMRYADVGGNVMFHVLRGDERAVVIAPNVDDKDPQRRTMVDMQLRRLAACTDSDTVGESVLPASKKMAASILAGENKYVVYDRAETVKDVSVRVSMSCHVYDIPLEKWPYIMENIGSSVHEGCLHFSNEFFEQSSGTLDFSGARYHIDHAKDTFTMGLGSSMANWYHHRWSDFMKYGANQLLYGHKRAYSYQITERRGDTLFFRIVEVKAGGKQERRQVYSLPTVERVEVHGFAVGRRRKASFVPNSLVPRTYVFPSRLWNTMLSYAKMELVRGGLDYNKMFNFYRTAVPRQSINSVTVSGGEKVDMDEVPALIVMAAAVAAADVMVLQAGVDAVIGEVKKERDLVHELTMLKVLNALFDAVKLLGYLAVSPFAWMGIVMETKYLDRARASLVSWRPQVSIKRFPYAVLADVSHLQYDYLPPRDNGFAGYLLGKPVGELMNVVEQDPKTAQEVLNVSEASLPSQVVVRLKMAAAALKSATGGEQVQADGVVASDKDLASVSGTSDAPTYVTSMTEDQRHQRRVHRRNAIKEAIVESELEGRKLQAACALWYRRLFNGNSPNKRALREAAEEMGNPDIWRIEKGILIGSELGQDPKDFQHSGVYTLLPDALTGSHLRVVMDDVWSGIDRATEQYVTRRHHFIRQSEYTGYALVVDELKIFNGPEIRATLREALRLPDDAFDASIVLHQGPPGCGKTTSIVKRFKLGSDVVLCPVKKSLEDTRDKLAKRMPELSYKMLRTCARTVDSYLVNWSSIPKQSFEVALGDECFITHSGKWYALIALLGVREFHGYGDANQLYHVARVDAPQAYTVIVGDATEYTWVTYRCAPIILAMWNGVYEDRVRSAVKFAGSVKWLSDIRHVKLAVTAGGQPDYLLLTMYQADKKTVQMSMPGIDKDRVMTTHESQGRDAGQVILVNYETRVRTAEDSFYLFYKQAYCNVALSRARREFIYVKQARAPDLVTQWMERATDSRRVAVAKELDSAGESKSGLT